MIFPFFTKINSVLPYPQKPASQPLTVPSAVRRVSIKGILLDAP